MFIFFFFFLFLFLVYLEGSAVVLCVQCVCVSLCVCAVCVCVCVCVCVLEGSAEFWSQLTIEGKIATTNTFFPVAATTARQAPTHPSLAPLEPTTHSLHKETWLAALTASPAKPAHRKPWRSLTVHALRDTTAPLEQCFPPTPTALRGPTPTWTTSRAGISVRPVPPPQRALHPLAASAPPLCHAPW